MKSLLILLIPFFASCQTTIFKDGGFFSAATVNGDTTGVLVLKEGFLFGAAMDNIRFQTPVLDINTGERLRIVSDSFVDIAAKYLAIDVESTHINSPNFSINTDEMVMEVELNGYRYGVSMWKTGNVDIYKYDIANDIDIHIIQVNQNDIRMVVIDSIIDASNFHFIESSITVGNGVIINTGLGELVINGTVY